MSKQAPVYIPEAAAQFEAAASRVRAAETISVVAHIKPDADAIGSACALAFGLEKLGKDVQVYIGQPLPHSANMRTIPGVGRIHYGAPLPDDGLVVTVDCASADRTGSLMPAILEDPSRVIVIDHHNTNPGFGGMNLIVESESTTVMVRELLSCLGVELDPDIAYCLYAGLVTDTGSFRWGTPRMHVFAAELMEYGLNTRQIALDLMDTMGPVDLQLMGEVLAKTQIVPTKRLSVAVLTIPVGIHSRMSQTAVESIIDYSRSLEGTDVGVVLKEQAPKYWAMSLRSVVVDVSAVAQQLGGGGHWAAAGYSATGTRNEVIRQLLDAFPEPDD
ncbi:MULTISPECIES: bifunctional oligoribonuclease/PAP phosphatase NrnA [unclassified Corynebacterium]|uniref:DHH family phosphoesterase n=1 Tax=unclassified Corynebacterium TaxID=2624378 RepID=UPI001EF43E8D|nr:MULTISPECIES: bifunctional oligoribonuclease/PAP phosphatase NrnA [unclassified Corynebacterium]MCG7289811.1 bifunctional oligoribonuclease/PAP phosphatase NrnA [Corynebacterium sp. ACRPZ]MCG7294530.1 bifunctional oligoribonuclease/PAP phosphatase NrnA [Corynebacterium sp. ACRPY]